MMRRCAMIVLLLGLVLPVGYGPVVAPRAQAATYCNIYPPSRIAIWRPVERVTVRFGAGCIQSRSERAVWSARYVDAPGAAAGVAFDGVLGQMYDSPPFTDRIGPSLTRVRWTPVPGDQPQIQNSPSTTIKLGAVSYVSVARFGGYHEVIARAYHYSPSAEKIVASGNRPGQVQFRTPGSPVWRPVAGIRLDANGQAVIRTWSPDPRYYRVSFGEQPTVFGTLTAEVRAR